MSDGSAVGQRCGGRGRAIAASASSAERHSLFNAAGTARRLGLASLFAIGPSRPGPALRRGVLVAIPVAAALGVELGLGAPSKGAIATGALLAGFPGLDAPAGTRAGWQAAAAPLIGLAAALGALTGSSALLAVAAMGLIGIAAGYCFAVSLRLSIVGVSVALSLVIAQGLSLQPSEALRALIFATAGGLLQAGFSLFVWAVGDRGSDDFHQRWEAQAAVHELRANLNLSSTSARHALRFGAALAVGVAAYWALGMSVHGFWIPLTILFVLRPEREETFQRLILRAVGTAIGLLIATALAILLGGDGVATALALSIATALAYGLLTVQYALFTTAITTYAVLLADHLGEGALSAAGQRAGATALGIVISAAAFLFWPNPRRAKEGERDPLRAPAR